MTRNAKLLRNISFGLTAIIILVLATATFVETIQGSTRIYSSTVFTIMWILVAISSVTYLVVRKVIRRKAIFLLHISFAIILVGAFVTRLCGEQGIVHLRQGETPAHQFIASDGTIYAMPFNISLKDFELVYYPGTVAPMDYISTIVIQDGKTIVGGNVSMNNIYSYQGYRFYQSTYDSDGRGSTLSVYHDPFGIAVTYCGYGLLLLSIVLFFFDRNSRFRQMLRHPAFHRVAVCVVFVAASLSALATEIPKTLPRETASQFGNLYVYYNDRICPLQTLAHDFTVKLYGKDTYKGLTAEQVFVGWFFYYDYWKEEPIIHIKSREVRQLLGIEGKYASLIDFFDNTGYKLKTARQDGSGVRDLRGVGEADEKFSLISNVCTGNAFKIYPCRGNGLTWYSVTDQLPDTLSHEQWAFIRLSMNYIAEQVARKDFTQVDTLVAKIRKYQEKEAANLLPSSTCFNAEKLYNSLGYTRHVAMICLTVGVLAFFFYCWRMARGNNKHTRLNTALSILMGVILAYIVVVMVLRGIITGHFPASNGFETMQLMASCVLIFAIVSHRRFEMVLSFGFMLCGLTLLVATFGASNPSITPLMPVLSSPLMSIHVAVIMISYSLFGFAMFNGIAAVLLRYSRHECSEQIERLQVLSTLMLYPAIFLLAIGIFIGAIWANVSWGRYWGWDPKETWALITLLVYAAILHTTSLPSLRRPMTFHWFTIIAFLSVLITYFGANFIMAGLHSYA